MKTCIKMSNGNVYVIEHPIEEVVAKLSGDSPVLVPGTDDRADFYVNPLQVCAIYPARED